METTTIQTRLREATRADLAGIWRVRYAVVENTLAPGGIEDDEVISQLEVRGRGWVIEEDDEIVAFAIGDARGANVWALFVHPRAEGRGHGSLLHDTMVEWLWTNGLSTVWLSTDADTKARSFYERRGWRCAATPGRSLVRLALTNPWY